MLFKEIIIVYSENHTKPINTFCGEDEEEEKTDLMIIKSGGAYGYHLALKG
jgi:hypothetical protein